MTSARVQVLIIAETIQTLSSVVDLVFMIRYGTCSQLNLLLVLALTMITTQAVVYDAFTVLSEQEDLAKRVSSFSCIAIFQIVIVTLITFSSSPVFCDLIIWVCMLTSLLICMLNLFGMSVYSYKQSDLLRGSQTNYQSIV